MNKFLYSFLLLFFLCCGTVVYADKYRVLLLGDTHYDADKEIYHSACYENGKKTAPVIEKEFARNATMWKERCPKLIASAYSKKTPDTSFVLQLGDLVQGDCGDPVVHTKMLNDTICYLKNAMPGLPFLTVVGNHDVRGKDARGAYERYMPARITEELNLPQINAGIEVKRTNFAFRHKEDLYVFVDFDRPNDNVIKEAFKQHADARYKFVITHGAVLPWDAWGVTYGLYGGKVNKRRDEMRKVFAENNVIVLTAHVHAFAYCKYEDENGTISQLMINSVWMEDSPKELEVIATKPEDIGSNVKRLYGKAEKELFVLDSFKSGIKEYFFAKGSAGYATMDVSDDGVIITYYICDNKEPAKVIKLR